MLDIMLDLETMGTKVTAPIVAIGAVEFDRTNGNALSQLYWKINLASAVECGAVIEPDTVLWWLQQSDAARAQLTGAGIQMATALVHFDEWLSRLRMTKGVCCNGADGGVRIWGDGAHFDNALLKAAYERHGLRVPWTYKENACYRTMKDLRPDVVVDRGPYLEHHALDDAIHQAKHLSAILKALGLV